MRKFVFPLLILAILAGVLFALFQSNTPDGPRQTVSADAGQHIFAAAFPDLAGKSQPLSQWRGKVIVLNFWASWCPPCRQEMPGFITLQDKFRERGLVFIGLALDERAKVQSYLQESPVNYPILIGDDSAFDLAGAIGNQQGGLPFSVLLDRDGRIVAAKIGAWDENKLGGLIEPLL